jgi:hypothetical protein
MGCRYLFFFVFLVCKCILVIHCCFQNKNLSYLKKIYFDSSALKFLGLYLNLLDPFVAYSQPFNLVYGLFFLGHLYKLLEIKYLLQQFFYNSYLFNEFVCKFGFFWYE